MMNWKTVKTVLWSVVGGALVWWIVLSAVFGWMTPGSAEKKAAERTDAAMLEVLAPICVEMFNQDSESEAKLKALKEESPWNRANYVVKQGWATMPGSDTPEKRIAQACADQILATSSS
jgi:hypothetical protein